MPLCSGGFWRFLAAEAEPRQGEGGPNGSRTRVPWLRTRCPRPLDDGANGYNINEAILANNLYFFQRRIPSAQQPACFRMRERSRPAGS